MADTTDAKVEQVQRFDPANDGSMLPLAESYGDGEYVLYADYAALQAEVARLNDWLSTAASALSIALPALLRLARAVADAPRVDADSEGMVFALMAGADANKTFLLLRADAADTTAGEG